MPDEGHETLLSALLSTPLNFPCQLLIASRSDRDQNVTENIGRNPKGQKIS